MLGPTLSTFLHGRVKTFRPSKQDARGAGRGQGDVADAREPSVALLSVLGKLMESCVLCKTLVSDHRKGGWQEGIKPTPITKPKAGDEAAGWRGSHFQGCCLAPKSEGTLSLVNWHIEGTVPVTLGVRPTRSLVTQLRRTSRAHENTKASALTHTAAAVRVCLSVQLVPLQIHASGEKGPCLTAGLSSMPSGEDRQESHRPSPLTTCIRSGPGRS